MDDIMYKGRYVRQPIQSRRKTKRNRRSLIKNNTSSFLGRIIIKSALCIFIVAVIGIIKFVDTPVTNFIQQKIKSVIAYNIEIKDLSTFIGGIFTSKGSDKVSVSENKAGEVEGDSAHADAEEVSDIKYISDSVVDISNNATVEGVNRQHSFIIPVGGVVGSFFGERVHTIKGTTEFHKGIDIEAQIGTPVKAAFDGEVLEAGEESTFGKYIRIKHDGDMVSIYAHCSALIAQKGQKVSKGDVIAKVGSTGLSQGPHLHFEIYADGEAVNPLDFIEIAPN